MIRVVAFHEKAEQEPIEAAAWYESKTRGLGRLFPNDEEHVMYIPQFIMSVPIRVFFV